MIANWQIEAGGDNPQNGGRHRQGGGEEDEQQPFRGGHEASAEASCHGAVQSPERAATAPRQKVPPPRPPLPPPGLPSPPPFAATYPLTARYSTGHEPEAKGSRPQGLMEGEASLCREAGEPGRGLASSSRYLVVLLWFLPLLMHACSTHALLFIVACVSQTKAHRRKRRG